VPLQEPFFSPPGARYARAWWRKKEPWGDVGAFNGLVYAHQLSITIGQAIRDLDLLVQVLATQDIRNRIEFLPL
jgi:hypothetical protein